LGCFEVSARLIVILLAGYTGIEEFLRAFPLNLREMNVGFLRTRGKLPGFPGWPAAVMGSICMSAVPAFTRSPIARKYS